jgi:hypothetical protein
MESLTFREVLLIRPPLKSWASRLSWSVNFPSCLHHVKAHCLRARDNMSSSSSYSSLAYHEVCPMGCMNVFIKITASRWSGVWSFAVGIGLNLQVTVQKTFDRLDQIHISLAYSFHLPIIHFRSYMDRFKIFTCVPDYGDCPSNEYAIMRIPVKFFGW